MHLPQSTELALRQFDANAALSAALADFQKGPPEATIIDEARRAAGHGLSWFARPSEPGCVEVRLRHAGGAEISAEGESVTALLAGLMGYPIALKAYALAAAQAAEPEQEEGNLLPATRSALAEADAAIDAAEAAALALLAEPTPSPVQSAAESLAAATGGTVVEEDPDESERMRLAAPLTDKQKAVCIGMIKVLTAEQRRLFTISFRHAFKVSREAKAIAPLITQVKHLEFCDRWSIEAAGGVAP